MDKSKTAQDSAEALNQKTMKAKSKSASERKSALDFRKYTKQIWLAGLGAFSRAEEEGNKLFDSLVKVGEELELVFKATVDKNWYIYSVGFDSECGPIAMSVTLEKHASFELVGNLIAIGDKAKHDKIFDCDVRIFEGAGEFRQKIKVLSPDLKLFQIRSLFLKMLKVMIRIPIHW